jgi:SAM-dependent methyltransferase
VVAADSSPRSLVVLAQRAAAAGAGRRVLPVVADVTRLPFADGAFASATTAETLEHVAEDGLATLELARVLAGGGWLVGTVPAGPAQWSVWDDWAGHLRRYTRQGMEQLLQRAGLRPDEVTVWGWPLLRIYDRLFLMRVNRRRLAHGGAVGEDPTLRAVAGLGRRRLLVALVQMLFALDRPFDGLPWGVGLLFAAGKASAAERPP